MNILNTAKKIIIAASIAAFIILAVLLVSFALPFFTATRALKARMEKFENITDGVTLQINDPYNSDGSVLPRTVDVFLDGEKAREISAELCDVTENAKYSGKETATHGSWDISLCLRSEDGITTVYLCEKEIYVTEGASKYSFSFAPADETEYSALYKKIRNLIYQEATGAH